MAMFGNWIPGQRNADDMGLPGPPITSQTGPRNDGSTAIPIDYKARAEAAEAKVKQLEEDAHYRQGVCTLAAIGE